MKKILEILSATIHYKDPLIALYMAMLENCRRDTKASIKEIGEELFHWRLADNDSSISDLVYHIAFVEADWLYTEVLQEPIPEHMKQYVSQEDRDKLGRLIQIAGETLESTVVRLDTVRTELMKAYRNMDHVNFKRLKHLQKYDVNPEWVLYHLMQHEAEHRGQINLLKRKWVEVKIDAKHRAL